MTLSTVICCYTSARRTELTRAVTATLDQQLADDRVIVVVDHNHDLLADLAVTFGERVQVIANTGTAGLSDARNTGLAAATGEVVVFVDDDATPRPGALDAVRRRFADPQVLTVGGAVDPGWPTGVAPAWFPREFGWVVGCDYRGLPADGADIRNPIGAAMAVRRTALLAVGGFSTALGRTADLPAGCEETLMGIALRREFPGARQIRDTGFRVTHTVTRERTTARYFARRCYQEGRSKARLATLAGAGDALASERSYTTRILPSALWHYRVAPRRAAALIAGFAVTCAGYLTGSLPRLPRPYARSRKDTA